MLGFFSEEIFAQVFQLSHALADPTVNLHVNIYLIQAICCAPDTAIPKEMGK